MVITENISKPFVILSFSMVPFEHTFSKTIYQLVDEHLDNKMWYEYFKNILAIIILPHYNTLILLALSCFNFDKNNRIVKACLYSPKANTISDLTHKSF